MSKFGKKTKALLAATFLAAAASPAVMADSWNSHIAYAEIIYDMQNQNVLHLKTECRSGAHQDKTCLVYPASITKLVTVAVVSEQIKAGKITLDTVLKTSKRATDREYNSITLGLKVGDQITLRDALGVLAKKSANDVAVVIAEGVAGSVEEFSKMMNAYVEERGYTNTKFSNPSGLWSSGHYSSPDEMVRIIADVSKVPLVHSYFGVESWLYAGETYKAKTIMRSSNQLNAEICKTGYVAKSGSNLGCVHKTASGHEYSIAVFGFRRAKNRDSKFLELVSMVDNLDRKAQSRKKIATNATPTHVKEPPPSAL